MSEQAAAETRDFTAPILWLWQAGLRFGGAIDVGCAEGFFSLALTELGPLRGAAILNVDAQEEFSASLSAIRDAIGGHFRICAVGARDGGTIELYRGAHPYWSSVRAPGDRYWAAHNSLCEETGVRVPLRSLDALIRETRLPGPYLLKLDVQGAERDVLAGARRTLADTALVLVETLVEEFAAVHDLLARAGFELFDLAQMRYIAGGALGWFHPLYLHARYRDLRPVALWDPALNEAALALQRERHARIEQRIAESLARLRAGRWPAVPV